MKIQNLTAFIILIAIIFTVTGCGSKGTSSEPLSDQAVVVPDSIAVEKVDGSSDYVVKGEGSTDGYMYPKLNISGKNAEKLNKEFEKKYKSFCTKKIGYDMIRFDVGKRENVISILVQKREDMECSKYDIYNISLEDCTLINDASLAKVCGYDLAEYKKARDRAVEVRFKTLFYTFKGKFGGYEESWAATYTKENLNKCRAFLGVNGKLYVIGYLHSISGSVVQNECLVETETTDVF